jgi:hypothetical protein
MLKAFSNRRARKAEVACIFVERSPRAHGRVWRLLALARDTPFASAPGTSSPQGFSEFPDKIGSFLTDAEAFFESWFV